MANASIVNYFSNVNAGTLLLGTYSALLGRRSPKDLLRAVVDYVLSNDYVLSKGRCNWQPAACAPSRPSAAPTPSAALPAARGRAARPTYTVSGQLVREFVEDEVVRSGTPSVPEGLPPRAHVERRFGQGGE
jgi:hypothetical protein